MPNSKKRTSFSEAQGAFEQLEIILNRYGITVSNGSDLERIILNLKEFQYIHERATSPDPARNYRHEFSEVLGLLDLAKRVIAAERNNQLREFAPHLKLLNSGVAPQNVRSLSDQGSNKVFEMFVGLICLQTATDLELDHPLRSTGNNPDVLTTIRGTRYGFACKVPNSPSLKTLTDRITEGVDQIAKSPCKRGFVTINLKNLTDHNAFWPSNDGQEFAWSDPSIPSRILTEVIIQNIQALNEFNGGTLLDFPCSTRTAGLLFFANTAILRATNAGPVPQLIGSFYFVPAKHAIQEDHEAIEPFNRALSWHSL